MRASMVTLSRLVRSGSRVIVTLARHGVTLVSLHASASSVAPTRQGERRTEGLMRAMRRATLGIAMLGAGAVACAGPSLDYTPQIAVVPGAAARSLWILSKSAEAGEDAEDGDDAGAPVELPKEAGADALQLE
jgi:hypothetical protein